MTIGHFWGKKNYYFRKYFYRENTLDKYNMRVGRRMKTPDDYDDNNDEIIKHNKIINYEAIKAELGPGKLISQYAVWK